MQPQLPSTERRNFITTAASALAATTVAFHTSQVRAQQPTPTAVSGDLAASASDSNSTKSNLRYCLNMSTINSSKVPLREQLQIASNAGYDAVELWLRDIETYTKGGGALNDLRKELEDLGLGVDSAIAFGAWIVDDDQKRRAGLEQSKRDMDILRQIGGRRIAAPPVGATNEAGLNLDRAAERYRALLEIGRSQEVVPQIELWGFSKNLSTLAEVLYVAAAANDPDACLLLDVYHLYKGGNDFNNVGLIPAQKMHCLHMNDYPAEPQRAEISDQHRVYPGDGVAPLTSILQTLVAGGFDGTLSLELFNRSYWELAPQEVANTGIARMKAAVALAGISEA
ncbi:sugar phosphate isomerase/epimerase family protein [Aureliella helgolandensis]|uniref:Inosose isomerase n=1 Tax=Aureliella helgolandensis TaxID=2527968 RepID=A0A518G8E6_9BACT|nr:sugar phosphate isomerase/epimerase family protein [Aureliella helgolandensis]QDV24860.1 Inosose isomerase [Aureliella helgolandensis]